MGEKENVQEMRTDWWHGIGKVSWQPEGCHGDSMTVHQPGKQRCRLPTTTVELGEQTKNFFCRLVFVWLFPCLLLEVDATREQTKHRGWLIGETRGVWAAPSGGEISVFWLGGLEGRRGCKRTGREAGKEEE